jgi:hypothetical protein
MENGLRLQIVIEFPFVAFLLTLQSDSLKKMWKGDKVNLCAIDRS